MAGRTQGPDPAAVVEPRTARGRSPPRRREASTASRASSDPAGSRGACRGGLLSAQEDFEVVGEAANGREAVAVVRHTTPDVLLVDLQMPELDGVGAIGQMRAATPATRILVLTTYNSDGDILRAVEAGATGYLLKDTPREELFKAIRATARGDSVLSPSVASKLIGRARGPVERSLSAREIEVLTLVARGVSNKIIGKDLRISEATVKTHLLHIFAKLGVDDRTAAVTAAMERGVLRLAK
ncbi:MAG TPA: response regulator transcription factor [Gemmatimonadales bacterium]|nr:response regulator transcription factor [Gemmatimonadales bacterium]